MFCPGGFPRLHFMHLLLYPLGSSEFLLHVVKCWIQLRITTSRAVILTKGCTLNNFPAVSALVTVLKLIGTS